MKRGILYLTSVIAALFFLTGCGEAGPTAEKRLDLTIVGGEVRANLIRYVVEVSGFGVEQSGTVTYIFECERHLGGNGNSVLTISTESGEILAKATRTEDNHVTLVSESGLDVSSASGTVDVTPAQGKYLSLAEWALLDANIFSRYPFPEEAPAGLKAWRDGLNLVNSAEPTEPSVGQETLSPQLAKTCGYIWFPYRHPEGGFGLELIYVCIYENGDLTVFDPLPGVG